MAVQQREVRDDTEDRKKEMVGGVIYMREYGRREGRDDVRQYMKENRKL